MEDLLASQFEKVRNELHAYLCRLVIRPQIAEELVQTTFLRSIETAGKNPATEGEMKAWLFRVATNLAFDELRRHSTWRETMLLDLREATEADSALVAQSMAMAGTPETKAIAREHIAACLACTLRNLAESKAASLLLKEVHGFTVEETAAILGATHAQVKNWLQEARAYLVDRYGTTCALVKKNGVCHQCVELDGFFSANQGDPLKGDRDIEERIRIASTLKSQAWGAWHKKVLALIDDLA